MKRIWSIPGLLCMTAAGCTQAQTAPTVSSSEEEIAVAEADSGNLRYDGLYCYIHPDENGRNINRIFRFYEDGSVISASIQESETSWFFPKGDWFRRESPRYENMTGTYLLDGNQIEITDVGETGTVDYWGTVETNCLVLDFQSNINGNSGTGRVFEFYNFDALPEYRP